MAQPIKTSPWWARHIHQDRRALLLTRNRVKAAIRAWFEAQGFVEVDTACLQVSPGNEAHLHAFATEAIGTDLVRRGLYLHTSPEFACKKLLAAGEDKIFTFAPVFRNRERGPLHHPEFTMLEWYRAGAPYQVVMDDSLALLDIAAAAAGADTFVYKSADANPRAPAERLTVSAAFAQAGIDLPATLRLDGSVDRATLAAQAERAGIRVAGDDTWSDIFSRILVARIEPALGRGRPTLLTEYPAVEAALARRTPADARVSERFELYVCGVELANGFGELTDATEQRRRFEAEMDEKARLYGERYPIDEDFLAALAHMPPASGVALGFDRLVMLATAAPRIDDVIWTPVAEGGMEAP
jgi:lysyl-tRNA synthetase class 2